MRRNPPLGLILGVPSDVNTKYVYGSGVGALNRSVRLHQKKRASFNCCANGTVVEPPPPDYDALFAQAYSNFYNEFNSLLTQYGVN